MVTSVTREGAVKATRALNDGPQDRPEQIKHLGPHRLVVVPAAAADVPTLTRTVLARAEPDTGYLPRYLNPCDLYRDVAPHLTDRAALDAVESAARRHVRNEIDFHRARCARCGVITYQYGVVDMHSPGG